MTGLRASLLLTTLVTACSADPISGGDSISGTGSGTGIDADSESESNSESDSGDEELTCEDGRRDELGAYTAMLSVALDRMETLETSADAAIGDMPLPSPADLSAQLNASLEGSQAVWIDWIRCEFTSDAFAESYAMCGRIAPPPILCEGPHDCSAECQGGLYVAGPTSCEGSCIGHCALGGGVACQGGWCTGTCTTAEGGEEMFRGVCAGVCEGSCEVPYGSCEGTCEGGCHLELASVDGVQCAGTCQGQASACTGAVTAEEDSSCARIAELRAVASPTCDAPDIVFPNTINAALGPQAQTEFIAFLDDLEPPMAELFAAAHQIRMMQDALSEPPCTLEPLEAELAQLTARLDALSGEIAPWLLPLAEPSPSL